jgi:ABC-type bacteriocin/lantibiotic exporter with double-glycine peptidase domain
MAMQEEYRFKKLLDLIKIERDEITSIYFYAILNGVIQLSLPLGIQAILGFVLGATMVTSVYLLIFIIIIAVLIVGYLQINQMKIIEKIQQKIFVRYAFSFAETIPKLDLKDIDHYYLPEKINRFFDVLNVQKGISKLLLDIPSATIQIIFGLLILSFYHPYFIVFSSILLLVIFIIFKVTSRKGIETSIEESNFKYKVVSWLEEMGRVIKSFKYSQGTHLNLIKTDEKLLKYLNARTNHFQILLLQFKSLVLFKVCVTALMLVLGSYLLFNQLITIGQFVAAEIIILTTISSMEKLISSLENVYDVITGLVKLDSVLDNPIEKEESLKLESKDLVITLDKMSFSYDDNQEIFNSISATILSNSITCISGKENSGKSTFLKLLTGSYMNFKGSIAFNGIPLQNYSLQNLRTKMGIFLYEQDLFEGSLYENIVLGRTEIKIERITDLSKKLGFEDFIQSFPNYFDTALDPLGQKLPSSLIRKILLLRALINTPQLLILEDPWIGFEDSTITKIQNYIIDISKNSTVVISTNDKGFIEKSTVHFIIENGTLIKA